MGAEIVEIVADLPGDVVADHRRGDPDRIGDALVVGAAMALHDQPVQAQKHRAIVIIGVEVDLEQVERGPRQREPALDRKDEVKARRRRSVTKRAVPSAVFRAIFPEKPSVTTTSMSPRLSRSPSVKPSNRSGR